jgi:hypothetical protein
VTRGRTAPEPALVGPRRRTLRRLLSLGNVELANHAGVGVGLVRLPEGDEAESDVLSRWQGEADIGGVPGAEAGEQSRSCRAECIAYVPHSFDG